MAQPSRSNAPTPSGNSKPCGPASASGVLHDFIARRHPDLVRVLPEHWALRSYWIVEHEDTRGIGRIRAVHDFLVGATAEDRTTFMRP